MYEIPPGIGRASERVLEGCLEKQVSNRWTIAMVDEVAWGIGWGTDGVDDEHVPSPTRPSPIREKSHHYAQTQRAHAVERSRSSSRPPRSTSGVRRSTSRSKSRTGGLPYNPQYSHYPHAHTHSTQPNLGVLEDSILRSISTSSNSTSISTCTTSHSGGSDPSDSALLVSPVRSEVEQDHQAPSPVCDRGRSARPLHSHLELQKSALSSSRSASPLEVPLPPTPVDGTSCERVGRRGRKGSPRHLGRSPIRHPLLRRDSAGGVTELDTVDEQEWATSPDEGSRPRNSTRSASYERGRGYVVPTVETKGRDGRPGSMPPAPLPSYTSWTNAIATAGKIKGVELGNEEVERSSPRPIPTPTRSRSAGFDKTVERMFGVRAFGS